MSKYITKTFTFEGKRYYVRGKTELEAEVSRQKKIEELESNRRRISRNAPVSVWAEEWAETYKKPMVNPRQYSDIKAVIRNFIEPAVGTMIISKVKPVHLQKMLNGLTEYSPSYIDKIYDITRQIFKEAYHNDLILSDPSEALKKPSGAPKKERRAITPRERELTLKVCETYRGGLFILIMLYCGLRPGEVAALQWSAVDLDKRVIHVYRALKSDDTIGDPKTKAGIRDVPLPDPLYQRMQREKHKPFGFVCTNTRGGHHTKSSIRQLWESFEREMNIAAGCRVFRNKVMPPYFVADDLTLYCYRHTYCTDLQAAGVPINVAKELMGHSSIEVTAKIYTHKSEAAFGNAADLINSYLCGTVALPVARSASNH